MVFIKVLEKFLCCVYLSFLEHPSPGMCPFYSDGLIFFSSVMILRFCVVIKKPALLAYKLTEASVNVCF